MVRWLLVLLLVLTPSLAEAGRTRKSRIYINGDATECPSGDLVRVFQAHGPNNTWSTLANVTVGDCISLATSLLSAFRLCCTDLSRCVDYVVPCDPANPPQCVTNYGL